MISKKTAAAVSFVCVPSMMAVAWFEFGHGKPMSEVHLITPVSLTLSASTSIVASGAGYHFGNAIAEALYVAPPDSRPLSHDGITHPIGWVPKV
jgi:hypothetical protein